MSIHPFPGEPENSQGHPRSGLPFVGPRYEGYKTWVTITGSRIAELLL